MLCVLRRDSVGTHGHCRSWCFLFFVFQKQNVCRLLVCVVGIRYMVVLIFMKWSIDWEARMLSATCGLDGETNWGFECTDSSTTAEMCPLDYGGTGDGCQPPNLITSLINIALAPGSCDEPMFSGQASIQVCFDEVELYHKLIQQ